MTTYEQKLDRDTHWAILEGSMHFDEKSAVHVALRKLTARLDELRIPYAVVGGMALFLHGFRRFTEDVDVLVTEQSLAEIHRQLDGLGYLPPFKGSKHLRDMTNGVRVEFLVTGQFPGDGKPKPVSFPDPKDVSVERDGIHILGLPTLIELKLDSGMTNAGRLKDLADVQELVRGLNLRRELVNELNPYVRDKYIELWEAVKNTPEDSA
jgi:hypothetical protein